MVVKLDEVPVIPSPEITSPVTDSLVSNVEVVPEPEPITEPEHESGPPDSESETEEKTEFSTPKRVLRVS